LNKHYKVSRLI